MTYNKVKWTKNKADSPTNLNETLALFSEPEIESALKFQRTHPLYTNTPLVSLTHLARQLNVADINVKDESHRFGLNAFKVMGGIFAIGKYIAKQLGKDIDSLSFEELRSEEIKKQIGEITFISATDGNHGRGVAWAARELGQQSIIYLPKGSTKARLEAIRNEGAKADIKDMNYDEMVRYCAKLADEHGYVMVQDTAWEGYEDIPQWIMQGYAAMAKEIIEELESNSKKLPTHVILQAGVGSFAAGIVAYFAQHFKTNLPKFIIVEPELANPYYRSFASETGKRQFVRGEMNSIMAGLCCGEPYEQAFNILSHYADAAFSCDDSLAALGMRVLGNPLFNDEKIISGESGAIPLGLLYYLRTIPNELINKAIDLNDNSRVLMISTEGNTDPEHYLKIVWEGIYPIERSE